MCIYNVVVALTTEVISQQCLLVGTLTIVLPNRNGTLKPQDMTPHPVTVYRHRANLSFCTIIWCAALLWKTHVGLPI